MKDVSVKRSFPVLVNAEDMDTDCWYHRLLVPVKNNGCRFGALAPVHMHTTALLTSDSQ